MYCWNGQNKLLFCKNVAKNGCIINFVFEVLDVLWHMNWLWTVGSRSRNKKDKCLLAYCSGTCYNMDNLGRVIAKKPETNIYSSETIDTNSDFAIVHLQILTVKSDCAGLLRFANEPNVTKKWCKSRECYPCLQTCVANYLQ